MWLATLREPGNGICAKWFTREILEGKGKEPGWAQLTMCKYPVARQVLGLVANVPDSSDAIKNAKSKIAGALASPLTYAQTFLKEVDLEQDGGVPRETTAVSYEASDVDIAKFCEDMPKCLVNFAEILHALYAGDLDDEMKALATEKSPKDTLMDDSALGSVSSTLQTKLREGLRLIASQTQQFTACSEQQELVSVRSLKRDASNPDDAQVAAAREAVPIEKPQQDKA